MIAASGLAFIRDLGADVIESAFGTLLVIDVETGPFAAARHCYWRLMIWLREIYLLLYVNDYYACEWKILLSWFGYVFACFISCDTDWLSCIELMTCAYAWAVEIIC